MAPKLGSSADALVEIWERFVRATKLANGLVPTKRAVSIHSLKGDAWLLSRWLNPGERKNWRIPMSQIPKACAFLGASAVLIDRLMTARLEELAQDNEQHEVLVAAVWAFDWCERHAAPQLTPDEEAVLCAYREAEQRHPRGLYGDAMERTRLSAVLEGLLQVAQANHEAEARALEPSPQEEQRLRSARTRVADRRTEAQQVASKLLAAQASGLGMKFQLGQFLKGLRDRRP